MTLFCFGLVGSCKSKNDKTFWFIHPGIYLGLPPPVCGKRLGGLRPHMTRLAAPCVDAVVEALRLRGSLKKAYRDIYMFSKAGILLGCVSFLVFSTIDY